MSSKRTLRSSAKNAKSIYLEVFTKILPNFETALTGAEQSSMINKLIQYNKLAGSHNQKLAVKYRSVDKTPIVAILLVQKELKNHENADTIFAAFNEFGGINVTPAMARYLKNYLAEKLFGQKMDTIKIVKKKDSLRGKSPDKIAKERSLGRIAKIKSKAKTEDSYSEKWALAQENNSLRYLLSNSSTGLPNRKRANTSGVVEGENGVKLVDAKAENDDAETIPTLSSKNWTDIPLKDIFSIAEVFNFDNDLTFFLVNSYLGLRRIFSCKKKLLCGLVTIINKHYYRALIQNNENYERLIDLKLFSLFTCDAIDLKNCLSLVRHYFDSSKFSEELRELTDIFNNQLNLQTSQPDALVKNGETGKVQLDLWTNNLLAKLEAKQAILEKQSL